MARLERILDRADELGMAPIVGFFYFGQDGRLKDEESVFRAAENATEWLLDKGYSNVMVEVANEVDVPRYGHPVLRSNRCRELIDHIRTRSSGRLGTSAGHLLVSTSMRGGAISPESIAGASDFILLHGNGVSQPDRIRHMVAQCRQLAGYRGQPVLFNEDDHFAFQQEENNMLAALSQYASWGYFDYCMGGEGFGEGFQSVPVDWTISSERKQGFFDLVAEVTGSKR